MANAEGSAKEPLKWRIWRWVKIVFAALVILFVAAVFWRMPYLAEQDRSAKVAQEIQDSHITMADVDGSHLPPAPDPAQMDATVEGVDANQNGIRDDVELAIFKKYPGDSNLKLRAAELQYARELQVELTSVFDTQTWEAAAILENNGISCMVDLAFDTYEDIHDQIQKSNAWQEEVNQLVFNTGARKNTKDSLKKYETSFVSGEGQCDIKNPPL